MRNHDDAAPALTAGARLLISAASELLTQHPAASLTVDHWLAALLRRHPAMVEALVPDLDSEDLSELTGGRLQRRADSARLPESKLLREAHRCAQARQRETIAERDLATAILIAAGFRPLRQDPAFVPPADGADLVEPLPPAGPSPTPVDYQPVGAATPALDRYGRDLTREAAEGKLRPLLGRDTELQLVVETLCRLTKRNPLLVGPAGVGKTAIVEGLAQRIVAGQVPPNLHGARLLALQPSALVAGTGVQGSLEERIEALLAEARQDGVVLFIDELHALVGSGGPAGSADLASLFKPALARGDLACLGATTDEEFRRLIEPDAALERRFQPLRVQPLAAGPTLQVLRQLATQCAELRGVVVEPGVLDWMVEFAGRTMPNRFFPDKAIDLLEQAVAHAAAEGATHLTPAVAKAVAQRMVGMPADTAVALQDLAEQVTSRGLLTTEDASRLIERLNVTMRGLDLRPARPNAVVLLVGQAETVTEPLAETIAATLFGDAERQVGIDFARFTQPSDLTLLLGAPPSYVGYRDAVPLHKVAQRPWCVLHCDRVSAADASARHTLAKALAEGFFTDGSGKRIYLSDAVVLLTAAVAQQAASGLGFDLPGRQPAPLDDEAVLQEAVERLGSELVAQCDLVVHRVVGGLEACRRWLREDALADLATRYARRGLTLVWDASVVDWLAEQVARSTTQLDWERLVDQRLSPMLVPHLTGEPRRLMVKVVAGMVQVELASEPPAEGA